ncbi:MAG: right-handed parallel beta-helix repeat-containing protein [Clostridiaceae bacterium]
MDMMKRKFFCILLLLTFIFMPIPVSAASANGGYVVVSKQADIQTALTSGKNVLIKSGEYFITSLTGISSNIIIKGENNVIINGLNKMSISITNLQNVQFNNITFKNMGNMTFKNSKNLKFTNCKFVNFENNGVILDVFNNIEIINCKFSNIASTAINPTWQGMGLYVVSGTGFKVSNSEFYKTYGHAAIFLVNTSFYISNNNIHDTFYRGIELFEASNSGTIYNNNIYNCGSINTTNSGVGCNGIYGDSASNVIVKYNKISNVIENAIEGNFKTIEKNTINGTGIDMKNHPTPSGEGIYIPGAANVVGNTIKNSYGPGIKQYSTSTISNVNIISNYIENCLNSDYAIDLNSETGYSNIKIINNVASKETYCIGLREKPKVNVVISNNKVVK